MPSPAASPEAVALLEYPRWVLQQPSFFEDLRVEDPLAQLLLSTAPATPVAPHSSVTAAASAASPGSAITLSGHGAHHDDQEKRLGSGSGRGSGRLWNPFAGSAASATASDQDIYDCTDDDDDCFSPENSWGSRDDPEGSADASGAMQSAFSNCSSGVIPRALQDAELVRNCILMTRMVFARIEHGQVKCCWPLGALARVRRDARALQWDKLEAHFHAEQPSLQNRATLDRQASTSARAENRRRARIHVYNGSSAPDPLSLPRKPVLADTAG